MHDLENEEENLDSLIPTSLQKNKKDVVLEDNEIIDGQEVYEEMAVGEEPV